MRKQIHAKKLKQSRRLTLSRIIARFIRNHWGKIKASILKINPLWASKLDDINV